MNTGNDSSRCVIIILSLVLAACGRAPDEGADALQQLWRCDGELEFASLSKDGAVEVTLPGRTATLPAVGSPDERRYARNELSLHFDGEGSARLAVGLDRHACAPKAWVGPWADARARGVAFRAVGQEPGWFVEVTPGDALVAVLDYGERTIELPAPEVTPLNGGARGYQADGEGVDFDHSYPLNDAGQSTDGTPFAIAVYATWADPTPGGVPAPEETTRPRVERVSGPNSVGTGIAASRDLFATWNDPSDSLRAAGSVVLATVPSRPYAS